MARRRRYSRRSRTFEAAPISYQLGGSRKSRATSYRGIYMQSQLEQVQNHMNMAATQLGNDYNLEIHRLSTLQDEMARLDDLIANWHDTEATAATQASSERRAQQDQMLAWYRLQSDIVDRTSDNKRQAREMAQKEASMPQQTRDAIQSIASRSSNNMSETVMQLAGSIERSGEFSNLASLPELQRHEAAVALKEAMTSRAASIPGFQNSAAEQAIITRTVNRLTGINPAEMSTAAYATRRSALLNNYERKYGYAGSVPPRPGAATPAEGEAAEVSIEGQLTPNDILKKWMDRRQELEDELASGLPSAPTYEDVRSLAAEQYQPRTARQTREEYQQQIDQQNQIRETVSQFPKDQRILMQAGRNAQRFSDGDIDAIGSLSDTESSAAQFIREQLQAGTLSMNELIPYATKIAEAEGMDASPEDVVSARDRILSDAMSGLMASYRNTLPSGDVAQSARQNVMAEAQGAQQVGATRQGVDYDPNAPTDADRRQDPNYIPSEDVYRSLLE